MFKKLFVLMTVVNLLSIGIAIAEEPAAEGAVSDEVMVVDDKPEPFLVRNKICPVCGVRISDNAAEQVTVDYNNKVYNLCSLAHKDIFLVDPEKYSKVADDEMAQATGMVMPEPAGNSSETVK